MDEATRIIRAIGVGTGFAIAWVAVAMFLFRYAVAGLIASRNDLGLFGGVALAIVGVSLLASIAIVGIRVTARVAKGDAEPTKEDTHD